MHDIRVLKVLENSENRLHPVRTVPGAGPALGNASALEDLGCGAPFPREGAAAQERGGLLPEPGSRGTNLASALWQSLEGKKRKEETLAQLWEYSDTSRPLILFFSSF